ncbi:MAG: HlyD family efflux transporter periplasmic adaptor subunit [Planctomycetaceae bacterium]|nr:HlyD family efflux transporter periplasmic adaptor subunit [Planctomycetaceae bacterium]
MANNSTGNSHSGLYFALVKVVISILCIVGALVLGSTVFNRLASLKKEPPREEPTIPVYRVETYRVEQRPIQRFVAGFGTAEADREVVVAAEVSGRISETEHLRVGDPVQGPQVSSDENGKSVRVPAASLLRIDPQTYEERVTQAQAMLTQHQVDLQRIDQDEASNKRLIQQQMQRLETAQKELDRAQRLVDMGAGRESDVSRSELEVQQFQEGLIRLESERDLLPIRRKQLQSQLTTAQSDLALATLELEKAHVQAPFSGVVSEVMAEEGQYVRPGEPLLRLTDDSTVIVPVPVSLTDAAVLTEFLAKGDFPLAQLVPDESALFRNEVSWTGYVIRIAPVADERTRTVMVFVEVDNRNSETPLRPGTFCYARIQADVLNTPDTYLIPRDAIVGNSLFVAPESSEASRSAKEVDIEVVRSLQSFVLVRSSELENAEVVMTNLDIVQDGSLLDVRRTHTFEEELALLKVAYLAPAPEIAPESTDEK